MKNLKVFLMSVLMVGLLVPTTSVSAEDTEVTASGDSSAIVTKTVESHYTVSIPKTVDLGNGTSVNFNVQAKGNIAPDETLSITAESTVAMSRENDAAYSEDATVSLQDATWSSETLTDSYSSKNGTVTFNESKAGSYSGTMTFHIELH